MPIPAGESEEYVTIHVRIPREVHDQVKWLCKKMGVHTQGTMYRWMIEAVLEAILEEGDEVHLPAVLTLARSYVSGRRGKFKTKEKSDTPSPFAK